MAGPADFHQQFASQFGIGDDQPCADLALLAPLKKSPEYRALHLRLVSPKAADSWQEDGLHLFVFQLRAADGRETKPAEAPVAVFTMHPEEPGPISVVVVTPSASGEEAEIMDLRQPESVYTMPIFADGRPARNGGAPGPSTRDLPAIVPDGEPAGAEEESPSGVAHTSPTLNTEGTPATPIEPASAGQEAALIANLGDIASEDRGTDDYSHADGTLLVSLKQSPEFQAIRPRLADPGPVDSWQEDGLHFFAFELWPADAAGNCLPEHPLAVFAMQPEGSAPVSAVVVTPRLNGEEAEIASLGASDSTYTAPVTP